MKYQSVNPKFLKTVEMPAVVAKPLVEATCPNRRPTVRMPAVPREEKMNAEC